MKIYTRFTLLFTACLALCGLGSPGAFGQPPSLINFRGQLLDNGGQPVTASVAVELRIFSAATGGTELYLEDMGYIEVRGGQYAFQFGANGNPDLGTVIQENAEAWVEVTVDNNALPRQRFVSVPYALNAGSAQIASGAVTPDMLSDSILKYLRPEIVQEPSFTGAILNGTRVELNPGVEGKYVTYQWYKDGDPIDGATSQLFTIDNFDVGYHDGNYTVVASNDFGSVESQPIELIESQQASTHTADLNASVALEMIWVEPGTFTMGSPESETGRVADEIQHEVTLTQGFYLGKYELTQAQYQAVMTGNTDGLNATPSNWPNNPDRPVEKVSHDDIQKFLTRLNSQQAGNIPEGWAYVLPTEAQWEYACRAGTTTTYSWGDTITSENANYDQQVGQPSTVGNYAANPWGFFDMHGNVWERTADAYANYATGAQTDPFNVGTSGSSRVHRGGSWNGTGTYLRSAYRGNNTPSYRSRNIGFRVGFQQVPADVASPEMQILGDANITQLQGVAWVDPGVEAHDLRDGNLSGDVTVSGTVDVNTVGTYTLTYTVSDAAGNQASLTRTVNIVEGQASTHTADLNSTVSLEMIWVEPGTFTMGSPETEAGRQPDETQHEVTLTQGFYLSKYELTQAQYEAVMAGNTDGLNSKPSTSFASPNHPVESVSWIEFQAFLARLNSQQADYIPDQWAYVLPTSAQWEYACRAGTTTAYSWGDTITSEDANWNHGSDANQTVAVGLYSPNPWGFFDMHGNVWEWTADWLYGYGSADSTDPTGPSSGNRRIYRGGGWTTDSSYLRSAYRYGPNPVFKYAHVGFRLAFQLQQTASNDFRGVDISSMNFEGQDLSDALFDSTTIFSNGSTGASFSGTGVKLDNLTGSIDLRGVNLRGVDLRGSDLSQAQFNEQTYITAANLSGTGAVFPAGTFDLTGSKVAGVNFSESNDLTISSDTVLSEYDEELGRYVGANIAFSTVNWGGVPDDLRGVNIAGVELTGHDLSNVQFDSSTIFSSDVLGYSAGASLSAENSYKGANLNLHGNVDLRGVNLYHANLTGSDLREAILNDGTVLDSNNLTRVNLCGVDLASAQFGDYASSHTYDHTYYNSATIFPEGFNPNDYPGLVLVNDTFTVEGGQGSAPFFLISNDQGTVDFTTYQLRPGSTYAFRSWEISQEHSFMIGESYGDMNSSMVYRGPLTRENEGSLMFLTIPSGFDGSLYYFCPLHSNMVQEFNVRRPNHTADLNASVALEMIWVEPGTFTMGQDGVATPVHEVTLTQGYYLGKYEVTQAQYEAVMTGNTDGLNATPSNWPNNPDRPVEMVSWEDIQVFLTRLNAQEASNIPAEWAYVLPTEAQWEYACRAGTTTAYSWGDSITSSDANSNYTIVQTTDVGSYSANPWGFFDMHGNVWEWTADRYGPYSSDAVTDPNGPSAPSTGDSIVFRGGSYDYGFEEATSAFRYEGPTSDKGSIGFRVAFQQQ